MNVNIFLLRTFKQPQTRGINIVKSLKGEKITIDIPNINGIITEDGNMMIMESGSFTILESTSMIGATLTENGNVMLFQNGNVSILE